MAGVVLTVSTSTSTLSSQAVAHLDRDALLIHFRVLMDFFYKPAEQDDIRAAYYVTTAPPVPNWHRTFEVKCNKLFALLTSDRLKRRNFDIDWYELEGYASYLNAEITTFLKSLDSTKLAWFQPITP